ncbi:hypothetical protein [Bradyrhizobium betae]|uniref:Uncharacterized protein n=1 Tax=Bradyrhizobium betae TaxID=244734 RepID=A0A5P6P180_9BRAD|nr:hypothetical protein [Bradyrhizobium betae]MCS3725477.1 hypothetical protein [Bradyrhizobium betae]QFI71233.1 hypothetical protein F8237_01885 [Bradyrhizobium betae]
MTPLPTIIDLMPQERPAPDQGRRLDPEFVIAVALSTVPYRWSGRLLSEESLPVRAVLIALKEAGYRIVPAE